MTDKTEGEIQRGEHAAQLLSDELLTESLSAIETEYIEQWKNSPARDEAGREKLWLMVKVVQRFRLELESVVNTGKVARHMLERETLAQQIGRMQSRSS